MRIYYGLGVETGSTVTASATTQSHSYLRASIAASTFGGDIGSSVNRRPIARSIALAMAAIGGQMLTSATPLAPYGWPGFGTSTRTVSIIGRSDATGIR